MRAFWNGSGTASLVRLASLRGCGVLLLVLASLLLGACGDLRALRDDLSEAERTLAEVSGTVEMPERADGSLILVVLGAGGQPLSYRVLGGAGDFRVVVGTSTVGVFVFLDRNDDLRYDANEAYAWQPLSGAEIAGQAVGGLRLVVRPAAAGETPPLPPRVSLQDVRQRWVEGIDLQLGRLARLDDARFAPEMAEFGMWQPVAFMKAGLAGIYFLEPYSPAKVPVLLVHGMHGTPRDLAPFIARLDRKRYQPWLYYYPTGVEVDSAANGLFGMLNKLRREYDYPRLHLVGYSMGGLVTRAFFDFCAREGECGEVRSLLTLASPFAGDAWAERGVKHAPVVMPVWRSLAPDSEFMRTLFAQPLPDDVRHQLVFAYRNDEKGVSGDGVVPLASQLRPEAQRQARAVFGVNADHLGILAQPEVAERAQAWWAGDEEKAKGAAAQ